MKYAAFILTDLVLLAYTYGSATALRVYLGAPPETFDTLLFALGPFSLIHVLALAALEGYDFGKTRSESDVAFSGFLGVVVGALLCLGGSTAFIAYYAPDAQVVPRSVFLGAGILNLVLLPGWRMWYTQQRRKRGDLRTRVLVVGPPERGEAVGRELAEYSRSGHDIIGYIDINPASPGPQETPGALSALPTLVKEQDADEVLVIAEGLADNPEAMLRIVELCDQGSVTTHLLPGFYETLVAKLDLYAISGLPLISLKQGPISPAYRLVKRAMDIACAAVGLVLAAPVLLATAIAIKRDSPGPVFYRQQRAGRGGNVFEMIKLRSMRVDAETDTGPVWAQKDDPRVTRVGRFLRNKRIDEIPQLWNVLKGEMSMVGPRPERPFFIDEFRKDIPLFPLRLRVKPGVTSLSHVWGRYDSEPADRLRYDLVYINNASLMLDLRILLETVKTVLTGRGAR